MWINPSNEIKVVGITLHNAINRVEKIIVHQNRVLDCL